MTPHPTLPRKGGGDFLSPPPLRGRVGWGVGSKSQGDVVRLFRDAPGAWRRSRTRAARRRSPSPSRSVLVDGRDRSSGRRGASASAGPRPSRARGGRRPGRSPRRARRRRSRWSRGRAWTSGRAISRGQRGGRSRPGSGRRTRALAPSRLRTRALRLTAPSETVSGTVESSRTCQARMSLRTFTGRRPGPSRRRPSPRPRSGRRSSGRSGEPRRRRWPGRS